MTTLRLVDAGTGSIVGVDNEVVAQLEELLALAKEGKLNGIAVAMTQPTGRHGSVFCGSGDIAKLGHAINFLQHTFYAECYFRALENGEK